MPRLPHQSTRLRAEQEEREEKQAQEEQEQEEQEEPELYSYRSSNASCAMRQRSGGWAKLKFCLISMLTQVVAKGVTSIK